MTAKVGVGGAWKTLEGIKVGVGGAWKSVTRAWVGVGGAWKEFYISTRTQLLWTTGTASTLTLTTCTASYKLDSDGNVYASGGTGAYVLKGLWLVQGAASDYEVYASAVSGTLDAGTLDTWLSLGTDRVWSINSGLVNTTKTATFNLTIRAVSDSSVTTAATLCQVDAEKYS